MHLKNWKIPVKFGLVTLLLSLIAGTVVRLAGSIVRHVQMGAIVGSD